VLPFTWYATIGKEDFQVFPVLFHFLEDSLLEVGAEIVQELGSWGDRVLLEKLVILDSNLFQYLFERFFFVGGLEPSISGYKRVVYLDWLILALGATPSNAMKIISCGFTTSTIY